MVRTVTRVGTNPSTSTTVRRKKRLGSPAFLHLVLRVVAQQSELFGLYATRDPHPDWRRERERELEAQGKPLDAVEFEVVLWELRRRNGIVDIWLGGPAPPSPEELPPGFRPELYPETPPGFITGEEGGEDSCAGEEPGSSVPWT